MVLENLDLRKAVIHNIHDMNKQELRDMVVDSIEQHEEKLLPGLGVVFEVIWENSNADFRDQMIATLHDNLPEKAEKPL